MSHTMTMEQGPNLRSQDVRYRRIGGDQPYRDDPYAPVHLEAQTRGGWGPRQGEDNESKGKHYQYNGFSSSSSSWGCCKPVQSITNAHFYRDDFNDLSWTCSLGTSDEDGIWLNQGDPAGTIMAMMVWVLLLYSALTITSLAQTGGIPWYCSWIYTLLCALALASHIKTSTTDPGAVPASAVPTAAQRHNERLAMCSQCQTFKPPMSHHCRICNRCISRMDHHCPWMNNCVGAANMKHFFLFLIYTWSCSVFALTMLGYNYFFCKTDECAFNLVLTQLVRIMTILGIGAFLFTSSMIMNVIYGLMTGIGTIDRLKKKATNTMGDSEEEPIPLTDVFGIGPLWTWPLPMDPIFEDFDRVMGYSTPQRLLREQILREKQDGGGSVGTPGMSTPTSQIILPPI